MTTTGAPGGVVPAAPTPSRRLSIKMVSVVAALLVAAGAVTWFATRETSTRLELAEQSCNLSGLTSDGGKTLIMRRVAAKENPGRVTVLDYDCVLGELKIPSAVREHMGSTRALDGNQQDSWENIEARWTYHPDDGVSLTLMEK